MKIKICGVTQPEDVTALDGLVDYIGFIYDPSSPRTVDLSRLREVRKLVRYSRPALVTASIPIERAIEIAVEIDIPVVQHHGASPPLESPVAIAPVAIYGPGVPLAERVKQLLKTPHEYVLVDADKKVYATYEGGLKIPLAQLRQVAGLGKVAIAGGITPENAHLVASLSPYMVDVSSGVEKSPGVKDMEKVKKLLKAFGLF
ncbi:MAG: phosphoribosylanthranilate isomerase [Pyrobaculum sp.]